MEERVSPCRRRSRSPRPGNGHGRFRRLERDGWPLGAARRSDEESGLERNCGRGPAEIFRHIAASSASERRISEYGYAAAVQVSQSYRLARREAPTAFAASQTGSDLL